MNQGALSIAGLILTALGASASAFGVIIKTAMADKLSGTNWGQNLHLKRALIKQSRWAAGGLLLIALGTILQIVAIYSDFCDNRVTRSCCESVKIQ